MTVVLDPGHGGHDPGAVGPTGSRKSWSRSKLPSALNDPARTRNRRGAHPQR